VALAKAKLEPYASDYELSELYSCDRDPPVENGRKICHVSLLVKDKITGARFVMDNGHVLSPEVTSGVGTYNEFTRLVENVWTGETPVWIALGSQ
jgi:hypothetical protein